jgi:hypothetical protein
MTTYRRNNTNNKTKNNNSSQESESLWSSDPDPVHEAPEDDSALNLPSQMSLSQLNMVLNEGRDGEEGEDSGDGRVVGLCRDGESVGGGEGDDRDDGDDGDVGDDEAQEESQTTSEPTDGSPQSEYKPPKSHKKTGL